jgi:hypothetical protein
MIFEERGPKFVFNTSLVGSRNILWSRGHFNRTADFAICTLELSLNFQIGVSRGLETSRKLLFDTKYSGVLVAFPPAGPASVLKQQRDQTRRYYGQASQNNFTAEMPPFAEFCNQA